VAGKPLEPDRIVTSVLDLLHHPLRH
jgi:hypothetical protein